MKNLVLTDEQNFVTMLIPRELLVPPSIFLGRLKTTQASNVPLGPGSGLACIWSSRNRHRYVEIGGSDLYSICAGGPHSVVDLEVWMSGLPDKTVLAKICPSLQAGASTHGRCAVILSIHKPENALHWIVPESRYYELATSL